MADKVIYDVYANRPIMSIPVEGTTKRMAFGVQRAKAILRYHDEIQAFVDDPESFVKALRKKLERKKK